jgi:hypothetical protein
MSIKARLDRLDRHQQQHQATHDAGAELRARMRAGQARLRQAAAEAGELEEYDAERRRVREAMAHDPDVLEAHRSGDLAAILVAGRRYARSAATSDRPVSHREGE